MKKIISLLLVLCMMFCLSACDSKAEQTKTLQITLDELEQKAPFCDFSLYVHYSNDDYTEYEGVFYDITYTVTVDNSTGEVMRIQLWTALGDQENEAEFVDTLYSAQIGFGLPLVEIVHILDNTKPDTLPLIQMLTPVDDNGHLKQKDSVIINGIKFSLTLYDRYSVVIEPAV